MEITAIKDIPPHIRFKREYKTEGGIRCKLYKQQSAIIYAKVIKGVFVVGRYRAKGEKDEDLTECAKSIIEFHNKQI